MSKEEAQKPETKPLGSLLFDNDLDKGMLRSSNLF